MNHILLVAKRIRALRIRHRLTQEECADVIGMEVSFYQQLESGRKKQMWVETVHRLASAFGLEAWQLLGPELPKKTVLRKKPMPTTSQHLERRRGPYPLRAQ